MYSHRGRVHRCIRIDTEDVYTGVFTRDDCGGDDNNVDGGELFANICSGGDSCIEVDNDGVTDGGGSLMASAAAAAAAAAPATIGHHK